MDGEHAVHARKSMRDAAARRVDMAFERGAGAERDDRHAMRRAQPHDLLHLLGACREDDGVRRLGIQVKVLACWVRTACDVETRFGQRAWRASTTRPTDETGVASLTGLLSFMSLAFCASPISARA